MSERVETVEVIVYPLHVGAGLYGDVFDRPEPEQVYTVQLRERVRRRRRKRDKRR